MGGTKENPMMRCDEVANLDAKIPGYVTARALAEFRRASEEVREVYTFGESGAILPGHVVAALVLDFTSMSREERIAWAARALERFQAMRYPDDPSDPSIQVRRSTDVRGLRGDNHGHPKKRR